LNLKRYLIIAYLVAKSSQNQHSKVSVVESYFTDVWLLLADVCALPPILDVHVIQRSTFVSLTPHARMQLHAV